ncbi:MAG TPA: DNA recombination protein RmuC [Tepidisphaeraceae bacterium]|nr:DNA recombination protein RmuC [Tepidisphaeraceae bacterium]
MVDIVIAVVSVVVGGIIGYLFAERKCRAEHVAAEAAAAAAEQRCADLSARIEREGQQTESLRQLVSAAEKDAAGLTAQLKSAQDNIVEQKQLLDDAHDQLRSAFASVSAEALAKNNEAFLTLAKERFAQLSTEAAGSLDQRKAQIEGLLKPMQEMLGQYQLRVAEIEKSRVESYSMLREQLGVLAETQRTLNTQTGQLVNALRRPNTRGQWGEITLKRLVELAGMSSRCDFVEQTSVDTEDGRQRPDMLIHLPGGRQIVIDCKAALDAFLDAAAAPDEDNRKLCLQRHCAQVRARARELSAKSYWSQFPRSPEFVVMFLPGEAFLYAAVEHDGNLIEDCLKNRVIVATPTTLIALLKAIEFGWRQEEVTHNAEEIRKLGKQLYERIATVAGHFAKLGANIDNVVGSYNQAIGSLETRVLVTVRKISELGARTDKELPEPLLVDSRPRELSPSMQLLPAATAD